MAFLYQLMEKLGMDRIPSMSCQVQLKCGIFGLGKLKLILNNPLIFSMAVLNVLFAVCLL
jgi:hypothetical protein